MISRVYIVIFFTTSALCFFDLVTTEYLIPTEPYHRDGFGHTNFSLPENDPEVDMKYKILSRSGNVFYIGGKGIFYRIDPFNPECGIAYPTIDIGTCAAGGGALPCRNVAPISEEVDCHNYIRIVEEYTQNGEDKLLVCGTNALEPRCYTFKFDAASCAITLEQPADGIGVEEYCETEASYDAKELAPRNWNLNSTYLWSQRESNPSVFFAGVSKSYDKTDPIWAKHIVDTENLGAEATPFTMQLDTYEIESRAVNEANFVGKPFEYTQDGSTFVLFFYRETAVEFINHGKIVYSRVGRVCRDDEGNSVKWSSFLKARLNCSLPDDYPAYFNQIQDITAVKDEDGVASFYAVMATPSNGVSTSALCRYRLDHIHQLFQSSKFKSPKTSKSLWLPVDPADVPNPRPGSNCNTPSRDTTFIQNNPLLDELVENYNPAEPVEGKSDSPLFFTDEGGRFSKIVVDDRGNTNMDDNIYYIGTETGNVLKAYINSSGNWTVFRYWQHADHEPINGLEFIPKDGSNGPLLFASTLDTLTKLDLEHGYAQNQDQYDMVYFPYLDGEELKEGTGVIITANNVTEITTCDNGQINLFCEGRLDSSSGNGNITWYKQHMPVNETDLGHLLSQTHLTGQLSLHPASFLTILALDSKTDGVYSCEVWYPRSEQLEKERVYFDIKVETCITTESVTDRKAEFEKVKDTADHRSNQYSEEQVCVIEHPILCERSCPYH